MLCLCEADHPRCSTSSCRNSRTMLASSERRNNHPTSPVCPPARRHPAKRSMHDPAFNDPPKFSVDFNLILYCRRQLFCKFVCLILFAGIYLYFCTKVMKLYLLFFFLHQKHEIVRVNLRVKAFWLKNVNAWLLRNQRRQTSLLRSALFFRDLDSPSQLNSPCHHRTSWWFYTWIGAPNSDLVCPCFPAL